MQHFVQSTGLRLPKTSQVELVNGATDHGVEQVFIQKATNKRNLQISRLSRAPSTFVNNKGFLLKNKNGHEQSKPHEMEHNPSQQSRIELSKITS